MNEKHSDETKILLNFNTAGEFGIENGKNICGVNMKNKSIYRNILITYEINNLFQQGIVNTQGGTKYSDPDHISRLILEHERTPFPRFHEDPASMLKDAIPFSHRFIYAAGKNLDREGVE
jgi:hypothetical protein